MPIDGTAVIPFILSISGGTYTDLATSGTQYLSIGSRSSPSPDPTDFYWTATRAGTFGRAIGNLEVAPAAGTSRIFRLYLNGAVQAVTLTFAAGVTQAEDLVNTLDVVRGDQICWRSTVTGAPAACDVSLAVEFTPT